MKSNTIARLAAAAVELSTAGLLRRLRPSAKRLNRCGANSIRLARPRTMRLSSSLVKSLLERVCGLEARPRGRKCG